MEQLENTIEYIEPFEAPLQHKTMAFWYKVMLNNESFFLTILASNGTAAIQVIKSQFPNGTHYYLGRSEKIMQINGSEVIDV